MRNSPPPPGSSWSSEPQGAIGPDRSAHQSEQVWAWPPAASQGEAYSASAWAWPPPAQPRRSPAGTARPPAGAAYHRMARTWRYRWWVPPVAVVTAVVAVIIVQVLLSMAAIVVAVVNGIQGTGDEIFASPVAEITFQLVVVATMWPIVVAAAWLIQRRPVGTLFSVTGRVRWRWLLCCAGLAVPAIVVSFGVLFALTRLTAPGTAFIGEFAGGDDFALAITLLVLLVPFQASAEEVALRGFLMQSVGSIGAGRQERRGATAVSRFLRTPVLAILVSGTVFTLLHDYFGWGLLDVAVFGIAMAWLTWFTGGLEAAVGLHVLHNLAAFGITAYEGALDRAATGGGSWQGVVSTVAEVAVYCAAVVWLARRMNVRRTVPADERDRNATGAPAALPQWAAEPGYGQWQPEGPVRPDRQARPEGATVQEQGRWQQPSGYSGYPDGSADGPTWAVPGRPPHQQGGASGGYPAS